MSENHHPRVTVPCKQVPVTPKLSNYSLHCNVVCLGIKGNDLVLEMLLLLVFNFKRVHTIFLFLCFKNWEVYNMVLDQKERAKAIEITVTVTVPGME